MSFLCACTRNDRVVEVQEHADLMAVLVQLFRDLIQEHVVASTWTGEVKGGNHFFFQSQVCVLLGINCANFKTVKKKCFMINIYFKSTIQKFPDESKTHQSDRQSGSWQTGFLEAPGVETSNMQSPCCRQSAGKKKKTGLQNTSNLNGLTQAIFQLNYEAERRARACLGSGHSANVTHLWTNQNALCQNSEGKIAKGNPTLSKEDFPRKENLSLLPGLSLESFLMILTIKSPSHPGRSCFFYSILLVIALAAMITNY